LERIREGLSDRDLAVLHSVGSLRFVSAKQLEALHFTDHASPLAAARTARRVLERLSKLRVLARLERRVGGVRAGSAGFVYRLGAVGDRLMRNGEARRRTIEPSVTFLCHTLAVSQVVVEMSSAARTHPFDILRLEVEPAAWREIPAAFARPEILKPDLFVALGVGEWEHYWFIEVDIGTEHLPTIRRKCQQYLRYMNSGREQEDTGVFPRVLWVVPTVKRAEALRTLFDGIDVAGEPFTTVTTDALITTLLGGGS
jgi:hypothetical protein